MEPLSLSDLLRKPPKGFRVQQGGPEVFSIDSRRTGMGCMNLFLMVWFAFWTVGCGFLISGYIKGREMESGDPVPFWFLIPFFAAEVAVAALLLYLLFARKTFLFDESTLVAETRVFRWQRVLVLPRDAISEVTQVKDGGEDEDSFPSWGLKVRSDAEHILIFRQPHEHSAWLGAVIASWAVLPFEPLQPEDA